jgi:hypothetical protein
MRTSNSLALKEWAVIIHALGTGKQTLLLRKGGLHERQGRFATEPREFFLFPTYVHQMSQGVVSEAAADLAAAIANQPPAEQLVIQYYATVEDLFWVEALDSLTRLAGLHSWTAETVAHRFTYGKTPGLHLFVLRVYRLPHAQTLPLLKRYGGCRSWVELAETLSTVDATPVLSDAAFTEQIHEVRDRLSIGPNVSFLGSPVVSCPSPSGRGLG